MFEPDENLAFKLASDKYRNAVILIPACKMFERD
jgi:hypothetical protein